LCDILALRPHHDLKETMHSCQSEAWLGTGGADSAGRGRSAQIQPTYRRDTPALSRRRICWASWG